MAARRKAPVLDGERKAPGATGRRRRATPPRRRRERAARVLDALSALYPDAKCALWHENPWQLLVATILSAQCTDERVNMVTPELFERFPTPEVMAAVEPPALEPYIASLGLFRNKARSLVAAARAIVERHGGQVPDRFQALVALPGVGRKTANVVLANAFGQPAIAVDTHVFRVASRIGLAKGKTPDEVEEQLMRVIPCDRWSAAHHWLIHHGRQVCHARRPACEVCPLQPDCDHFSANGRRGG